MTKKEALKLLASNHTLSDLHLKQIREAIANGVSSAETDAAVAKLPPTSSPITPTPDEYHYEASDEYESSESYDEWESSEC